MLSACPLLKVVYLQWKHCRAYLKSASMPFQPALSLEKSLKDSWPIKHNFIFSPQITSFVPLWQCRMSTEVEKYLVCVCVHAWACVYQMLCAVILHRFGQYSSCLRENPAQQPVKQPARKSDRQSTQQLLWGKCAACVLTNTATPSNFHLLQRATESLDIQAK